MLEERKRSGSALTALLLAAAVAALSLLMLVHSASGKASTAVAPASSADMIRGLVDHRCAKRARTFVYLFWPKGHSGRGVPSEFPPPVRFPGMTPDLIVNGAHVSVWLPGESYPNENLRVLAGADYGGYYTNEDLCPPSPGGRVDRKIANRVVRSRATAVSCRFQSRYGYVGTKMGPPDSRLLLGHDKRRVFLKARLRESKPRLTYDSEFCKRIALPTGD